MTLEAVGREAISEWSAAGGRVCLSHYMEKHILAFSVKYGWSIATLTDNDALLIKNL